MLASLLRPQRTLWSWIFSHLLLFPQAGTRTRSKGEGGGWEIVSIFPSHSCNILELLWNGAEAKGLAECHCIVGQTVGRRTPREGSPGDSRLGVHLALPNTDRKRLSPTHALKLVRKHKCQQCYPFSNLSLSGLTEQLSANVKPGHPTGCVKPCEQPLKSMVGFVVVLFFCFCFKIFFV